MPDKTQPNAKVINELKRLLAFAEKGDITEMAFVAFGEEVLSVGYHYSVPTQIPAIAGETGALAAALHGDMLRGRSIQMRQAPKIML